MTHDYKRHGTTTLFAALNVLDGTVIGSHATRHHHQEFLRFLKRIERTISAGSASLRQASGNFVMARLLSYLRNQYETGIVHDPGRTCRVCCARRRRAGFRWNPMILMGADHA